MEVLLASHAGTCFGVKRAIDLVNDVAERGKTAMTLGPIIHNPRVVEGFRARGIDVAKTPAEVRTQTVVIRSHGVLPEVRAELEERGLEVVDATCPFVLRAQRAAAKLAADGRMVVVVGERNHPEVEGLVAWAEREGAQVVVVGGAQEVPADLPGRVGVVVQTTQRRSVLDEVVDAIEKQGVKLEVANTICGATAERQDAAMKLACCVDAMVVLGGKNSSNTKRLAEICASCCERSYHVESPEELSSAMFKGCERVGVTAGASTPQDQIAEIICTLENLSS